MRTAPSVRDRRGDILEERLVLLDPMTGAGLSHVEVARHMVADHSPVRLVDVEVKNARLLAVDPDDRVKMMRPRRLLFVPENPLAANLTHCNDLCH